MEKQMENKMEPTIEGSGSPNYGEPNGKNKMKWKLRVIWSLQGKLRSSQEKYVGDCTGGSVMAADAAGRGPASDTIKIPRHYGKTQMHTYEL